MVEISAEQKCVYNYLGKSGLRVSNICLGAMTFGETHFGLPNQLDEAGSHKLLNRFVEWGGNFIDTANVYGRGNSESVVGSWLTGQERDRIIIATKVRGQMKLDDPNGVGLSRHQIVYNVERSLERLKTDYIDLYQIHCWDSGAPIEETLRTLNDLVRIGKVRYIGASNVTGWQLQKIVDYTDRWGLDPFVSLQPQYNLLCREPEFEPLQVCQLNGLGVLPWSPLKGGFLTGKYRRDSIAQDGRIATQVAKKKENPAAAAFVEGLFTEKSWKLIDQLEIIGNRKGKSIAQVALRWLLQKPIVTSVIIGATKLEQLEDNMGAANGWELTPEEMKELDELSKPAVPYPYEFVWRLNENRNNPWNPNGKV